MKSIQRMNNDLATIDRREIADQTTRENRTRNDELTWKRRIKADKREKADPTLINNRIRNDESTEDKRFKADKNMNENRLRNDEITSDRREVKDRNLALGISLAVLIVFAVITFLIFV